MKINILIMAAGASRRLGQPKQLLDYQGQSLLRHCISECLKSKLGDVIVTLGSTAKKIKTDIDGLPCQVLINKDWSSGLGNNIAFTLNNIDTKVIDGVIIVLADQPFMKSEVLTDISKNINLNTFICCARYKTGSGPPIYFSKILFEELTLLDGNNGAKNIVKKHIDSVEYIDFPKGHIDIDTPEDLKYLNHNI